MNNTYFNIIPEELLVIILTYDYDLTLLKFVINDISEGVIKNLFISVEPKLYHVLSKVINYLNLTWKILMINFLNFVRPKKLSGYHIVDIILDKLSKVEKGIIDPEIYNYHYVDYIDTLPINIHQILIYTFYIGTNNDKLLDYLLNINMDSGLPESILNPLVQNHLNIRDPVDLTKIYNILYDFDKQSIRKLQTIVISENRWNITYDVDLKPFVKKLTKVKKSEIISLNCIVRLLTTEEATKIYELWKLYNKIDGLDWIYF